MNREQFLETESALYNQLALQVGEDARKRNGIFLPEVGSEYKIGEGLMILGRAARFGEDDYTYDDYVTSPRTQVEEIFSEQLEWAEKDRGNKEGRYNPATSPFWRVIRKVSSKLYSEADWYKHIIYNNLYRVSADKNPADSLCYKQIETCGKLLYNEIAYFAPKAVLCLTGMAWAQEVLEEVTDANDSFSLGGTCCEKSYLDETGIQMIVSRIIPWGDYEVSVVKSDMTTFLITEHPQGKPEDEHVEAILKALDGRY